MPFLIAINVPSAPWKILYLNLATGKFGVYAYLLDMRGTGATDVYNILQGSGNKADLVKLQVPKGSKHKKIIVMEYGFL